MQEPLHSEELVAEVEDDHEHTEKKKNKRGEN